MANDGNLLEALRLIAQDMADESEATAALRIARAALKHERPLPEWAKTAIANGWKP